MRIAHLSDIHLSNKNLFTLRDHYLAALTKDLAEFNKLDKLIDFLIITGDLLDKGGESLGQDPYSVFAEVFLQPIANALQLNNDQILFIPGNHDIQRESIETYSEFFLASKMDSDMANEKLEEQKSHITDVNRRIEKFKNFEKEYHDGEPNYFFSYNESLAIRQYLNYKIGFALINDSWRCSSNLKKEEHFVVL